MADLEARAQKLAEVIFNGMDSSSNYPSSYTLETVQQSLAQWQELTVQHGFELVGVNIYLPSQLALAQREALKQQFLQHGFHYENVGEQLTAESSPSLTTGVEATANNTAAGGSNYIPHPELDMRGMPLQRFYLDEQELTATNTDKSRTESSNDYQLSLRFSPSPGEGTKLKDKVVYKPGAKPPAPTPRIDLTIRPC